MQNWTDIRVFLAVVQSGSTLAASRSPGMSQPAVACRTDALKLTLFERDTRGFHAPAAARDLVSEAMAVQAAVGGFLDKARSADNTVARPIRFSAPPMNFSSNMSVTLSDFLEDHPGVR